MKRMRWVLFALLMVMGSIAQAMEGEFDRSAEVAKYSELFKSAKHPLLIPAAKEVYVSGITDPALAAVINERLQSGYRTLGTARAEVQYGQWMVKALASFGLSQYIEPLRDIRSHSPNSNVRDEVTDELALIDWHAKKNAIMAGRQYYHEGDNPRVIQLLNLVMADDYSYKRFAAERISWEKLLDPRLMDAMAPQVQQFIDRGAVGKVDNENAAMGYFIKLLGYTGDAKYRPMLAQVARTNASMAVKKHARQALEKIP